MNLRDLVFGVEFDSIDTSPVKNADSAMDSLKDSVSSAEVASNKATKSMSEKWSSLGDKMESVGKKMSLKITTPILAIGGASYKMAADTEDAMGATEQIFQSASGSMKKWADSLPSYYGVAGGEALEYSNVMGSMLKNIGGLTEEESAKQAQSLVELSADLSAMFGGSTESAITAITGALKGNNTMLDNYGMGVNEATVKAKALEMGLMEGTGEMTLQTKQAATLALIMEQTGDAQGQAAREAEGASGTMKAFAVTVKDLSNAVGETLLPIITPMLQTATDLMTKFKGLSPAVQENIVKFTMVAAAIGPVVLLASKMITLATTLGSGFIALKTVMTATMIPAMGSATASAWAFTTALLANPVTWVVVGIVALGAAIWALTTDFGGATTFIKDKFSAVKDWFSNVGDSFKDIGSNIISSFISGFNEKLGALKDTVVGAASSVGGWFKDKLGIASPSKVMVEAGINTGEGVSVGLQKSMPKVKKSTNEMADGVSKQYNPITNTSNRTTQGNFAPTLNIIVNNPKDNKETVRVMKQEWEKMMAQYQKRNNLRYGGAI